MILRRALFLPLALWALTAPALPAQDDFLKDGVQVLLEDVAAPYRSALFFDAVRLPSPQQIRGALASDLEIQLDPELDTQGKYYPGEARLFGRTGIRNHLLIVRTLDVEGQAISLYHEFLHHLVHLEGGMDCGSDETYAELMEDRLRWLNFLQNFDQAYRKVAPASASCRDLLQRWEKVGEYWRGVWPAGNPRGYPLSGPAVWTDPQGTCETEATYRISREFVEEWDRRLGIELDLEKIERIYRFELDRCRELVTATGGIGAEPPGTATQPGDPAADPAEPTAPPALGEARAAAATASADAAGARTACSAAGAAVDAAEASLGNVSRWLDAAARDRAAAEAALDDLPGFVEQAREAGRRAYGRAGELASLSGRVQGGRDDVCARVSFLGGVTDPAEYDETLAGAAAEVARIVPLADEASRIERAIAAYAEEARALATQAQGLVDGLLQASRDATRVAEDLPAAERELDAARRALAEAAAEAGTAAGSVGRLTRLLAEFPADAEGRVEIAAALTGAREAARAAEECRADVGRRIDDAARRLQELRGRADGQQRSAADRRERAGAGPLAALEAAAADAEATRGTAEVFVVSIETRIEDARRCLEEARRIPRPEPPGALDPAGDPSSAGEAPPDGDSVGSGEGVVGEPGRPTAGDADPADPGRPVAPDPGAGQDPGAGGGFVPVGTVRTVSSDGQGSDGGAGGDGSGSGGAGADLEGLAARVRAAMAACRYPQALALIREIERRAPGSPFVARNLANVENLAGRQLAALPHINLAIANLRSPSLRRLKSADEALSAAIGVPPPACLNARLRDLQGRITGAIDAARKRRADAIRGTVEGVLGDLAGIAAAGRNPEWEPGDPVTSDEPRNVPPPIGGTGSRSEPGSGRGGGTEDGDGTGGGCVVNTLASRRGVGFVLQYQGERGITLYNVYGVPEDEADDFAASMEGQLPRFRNGKLRRFPTFAAAEAAVRRACPNPIGGTGSNR